MRKIMIMALAAWLLSATDMIKAMPTGTSAYYNPKIQTKSDRKAERAYKKEQRKAKRAEYRARLREGTGQSDHARMMRENNKQRKKMDRAARMENRRSWGQNELGDVFSIY